MTKRCEIEIARTNVTPQAFWSYCKKQVEKHNCHIEDWLNFEDWSSEANNTPYHTDEHADWNKPQREANKHMPFDVQMYLQGAYNFIMEFDFFDSKTGTGYLYMIETER